MIIIHIIPGSGMGNQMFMYAAGLVTAHRLNTELRLGAWNYDHLSKEVIKWSRPWELKCFPAITERNASFRETFRIAPGVAILNFIDRKPTAKRQIFKRLIRKILRNLFYKAGSVYNPSWCSYSPEFFDIKDNTFISGYWESEKIFAGAEDLVRERFKFAPSCFDSKLSAMVKSCNSVAVHIRRGDKSGLDIFSQKDFHYLRAAFEKITALTDKPKFFVFSDDIAWCRENIPQIYGAGGGYTFIDGQTPPQDMALMTQCKHVIVGPSTFSWWGAWLNDNPQKIVIAPDINLWYKPGTYNPEDRKYLLPESWIKIS